MKLVFGIGSNSNDQEPILDFSSTGNTRNPYYRIKNRMMREKNKRRGKGGLVLGSSSASDITENKHHPAESQKKRQKTLTDNAKKLMEVIDETLFNPILADERTKMTVDSTSPARIAFEAPAESTSPVKTNIKVEEKWYCSVCLVDNVVSASKCVCCEAPKPATVPEKPVTKQEQMFKIPKDESNIWYCQVCNVDNKDSDTQCVCCETPRPGQPKPETQTMPSMFNLPNNGKKWFCPTCNVDNEEFASQCVCCETKNPNAPKGLTETKAPQPVSGGFKFPVSATNNSATSSGGFKFPVSTNISTPSSGGFKFPAAPTPPPPLTTKSLNFTFPEPEKHKIDFSLPLMADVRSISPTFVFPAPAKDEERNEKFPLMHKICVYTTQFKFPKPLKAQEHTDFSTLSIDKTLEFTFPTPLVDDELHKIFN